MPPDSTTFVEILLDPTQWTLVNLLQVLGVVIALGTALVAIWRYWRQRKARKRLEDEFGSEFYSPQVIYNSTRYYVRPKCSGVDPAQEAEIRQVVAPQEDLFDVVDRHLKEEQTHRHLLLLADSGMGKSSFVLNYYSHNQRLPKRRRQRLAVVPLGIPNAAQAINKIADKKNTVIFLDAFDEDSRAIKDHRKRLDELMKLCAPFKRALITCRTQFFPKDEEIPKDTGIIRVDPRPPGVGGKYEFWKLYLLPLDNEQVEAFLRRRYSIFQLHQRSKARTLIQKIPLLSVRPMLLAYIPDVLQSSAKIEYSFQLYEILVAKWLERESGWVKPEALRAFSERLAVDLFVNLEKRGEERIAGHELAPLAREWKINLEGWQLRSRSLLNRDAAGHYKFAHRSIMEYLFVERFIAGEKACTGLAWTDQMKRFIIEVARHQWQTQHKLSFDLSRADLSEVHTLKIQPPIMLRKTGKSLSEAEVKLMLQTIGLPDSRWNNKAQGLSHVYEPRELSSGKVVADHMTGLMWQQTGSTDQLDYAEAQQYIRDLNNRKYTGYEDWRLPTLEEAMSLMESTKKNGDLYIDPVFDKNQNRIWIADKQASGGAWYVYFDSGHCFGSIIYSTKFVRAVRSGQ